MATIRSGNWSLRDPGDAVPDGAIIEGGNFMQLVPGTVIMAGKNLTINGGNFVNVKKDPKWTVNGGNFAQISRCSHLHPEWVAKGLPEDPVDCEHRVGDTKQWVEIDEREYRAEKNSLSADKGQVQILKATDGDGVTVQTFQKSVFVYRDKVVT